MDKVEARSLLEQQIERLRKLPYGELRARIDAPEALEVTGESGTAHNIEVQVFWDGRPGENLRVMVSVDDGGWRAMSPLTSDFIMAPDGSFVGE